MLKEALEAPTRQIAENAPLDGGVVVDRMRTCNGNCGLDASTGKYVDLIEAGIIDPTKVVRIALENAVSVATPLGRGHIDRRKGKEWRSYAVTRACLVYGRE
jgi:chaperonin GroEL